MISAATVRPSVDFRLPPSPASRTSPSVTLSPALPSSLSTTILSPGATRYCLPPVRTTANIGSSLLLKLVLREQAPRRDRARKRAAYGSRRAVSIAADRWLGAPVRGRGRCLAHIVTESPVDRFSHRIAVIEDLDSLREVMRRSIEALQGDFLSPEQITASHK